MTSFLFHTEEDRSILVENIGKISAHFLAGIGEPFIIWSMTCRLNWSTNFLGLVKTWLETGFKYSPEKAITLGSSLTV